MRRHSVMISHIPINIRYLDISNTSISDVSAFRNLKQLKCSRSAVTDVSMLSQLTYLSCNSTGVVDH
jgi:Leucine-rich repeat (LRR) protein